MGFAGDIAETTENCLCPLLPLPYKPLGMDMENHENLGPLRYFTPSVVLFLKSSLSPQAEMSSALLPSTLVLPWGHAEHLVMLVSSRKAVPPA